MHRTTARRTIETAAMLILATVCGISMNAAEQGSAAESAQRILQASGVTGGLVVHVGCGDGKLTAALAKDDGLLVHGLDADPENVAQARRHVNSLGLYGQVSIDQVAGDRLPYVDNLVNLLVAEDLGSVPAEEVARVLCPGGVAYLKQNGRWSRRVKPTPEDIDDWTHHLYDATGNAVSNDFVSGPPQQLQWVGQPKWARSHDHLASVSAVVTSGGRLFSIVDEAPTAAVVLEPDWKLVARDAYNGVILWKRDIPRWEWHLRGFRCGPSDLAERLVAVGDRVYVTLEADGPLSALDAATGKTITTYRDTDGTREVLYHEGTLFIVAGDGSAKSAADSRRGTRPGFTGIYSQRPEYAELPPAKRIVAIDAATGRLKWKKADADTSELMPTTLTVGGDRVFFQSPGEVICLASGTGKEIWRADRPTSRTRPTWSATTLVVYDDVVLSGDREVIQEKTLEGDDGRQVEWIVASRGGQAPVGELIAFSAEDGKRLWSTECKECYNAPVDVLVADGLVWTGKLVKASEPGVTEGLDPKTGEVVRTRPDDLQFFKPGMGHGRCYRNKATNKYLVMGRSGVEFIDLATGLPIPNHWTRGTCQYGVMPACGMLYVPPHSCACFVTAKLNGFNCFAPKRPSMNAGEPPKDNQRLQKGPAYGLKPTASSLQPSSSWPTYRHDPARTGRTDSAVAAELKRSWQTDLGGRLSSVTVADGRVFVAQVDAHAVCALDSAEGDLLWTFTAGGRVDSPPTAWGDRVLFGSADGSVYCLSAADGRLAWRFRAAPLDMRIVSCGQIESAWPVHGSVLVHDGVAYAAAGRSSYLEGSIRLCRLDAATGRLLSETVIDHRNPETGYQPQGVVKNTDMPGALPDVLSCDGESVFMRHQRFNLEGQPQAPDVAHLYSPAGFIDDAWWHRTYWMFGTTMGSNYGGWPRSGMKVPAGRLLALDDSTVYGFGRDQYIHHGAHIGIDGATVFHFKPDNDAERRYTNYQAFAIDRPAAKQAPPQAGNRRAAPATREKQYNWTEQVPLLVRGLVLAGDKLITAGTPDLFAASDPAAALAGKEGGLVYIMSTSNGKQIARYELDSPPVFDGMAAAGGRLYLAATNGEVVCFASE